MSDQDQAAAIQQEIARRYRGDCEWSAERMLLSGEAATCVEVSADLIDWCDTCLLRAPEKAGPASGARCTECSHVFTAEDLSREDAGWGHPCPGSRSGGRVTRCESFREPVAAPPAEGEALRRLPDEDVAALDPGIRDLVLRLRAAGFETTDSGDGVSKPADWYKSGEGMPFPHVVAQVTPANLQSEARRMLALLGDEWGVEATYYPAGETALLMTRPNDERLAELRAAQGGARPSEPLLDAARAAVAAYWAPEPDSRHGRGRVMQSMINLRIAAGMPWPVEGGAARRVGAHAPGRCGGPTVCSWCAREK